MFVAAAAAAAAADMLEASRTPQELHIVVAGTVVAVVAFETVLHTPYWRHPEFMSGKSCE